MKQVLGKWILAIIVSLSFAHSAFADIADCDRLAANPPDPDRVAEGVPRANVDIPAAIKACESDLAREPDNLRFAYQLGRVHFYAGETEKAMHFMEQSAEGGYRQAEFVLGLLIDNNREGAGQDFCRLEDYWVRAARKGHVTARLTYVRHVTKGYFSDCDIQASEQEIKAFIDLDTQTASSYLNRLLVDDLKEDVERYLGSSKSPQ